ncbi:MAG: helix-hairpin-helix domain-containing protein [Bacteroidales bacterium]|nr:helix-hairpin-helix domain-containing protein [Bacteroidales bacterium]
MRFPFVSRTYRLLLAFCAGVVLCAGVVFFFVKDNFAFVDAQNRRAERQEKTSERQFEKTNAEKTVTKYRFKPFNPNTVSFEELLAFGLSKAQASNIVNYRDKSGGFRDKAHFRKLYCMTDELFALISPYLIFESKAESPIESIAIEDAKIEKSESKAQRKVREVLVLDLNACDSLDLQQIRGIGKVRAARIYKYGKRLGGYVNVEQLKEVYGIDNELFEQIKPHFKVGKTDIRKININSDEIKYLTSHPYIDFQLAKALIRFRKDYGKDFQSAEEIRYIHFLSEQEAEKLIPYLKTSD